MIVLPWPRVQILELSTIVDYFSLCPPQHFSYLTLIADLLTTSIFFSKFMDPSFSGRAQAKEHWQRPSAHVAQYTNYTSPSHSSRVVAQLSELVMSYNASMNIRHEFREKGK